MNHEIRTYKFAIDTRPICIWAVDLKEKNLQFLNNLDPDYFIYTVNLHSENLENQDTTQYSAIGIRSTYSQCLELLFGLIAATLQAPHSTVSWITLYKNIELDSVISKIQARKKGLFFFDINNPSWEKIVNLILENLKLENQAKELEIKSFYAKMLAKLATDFLSKNAKSEYNAIKHGFRIKSGGFYLKMGAETTPGIPAPKDQMVTLADSEFGTSTIIFEKHSTKNNWTHKTLNRNWNPEAFIVSIHFMVMFIKNNIAFLKIKLGEDASTLEFASPKNQSLFEEAWRNEKSMGVTEMIFGNSIADEIIKEFSKEEILKLYQTKKA